MSGTALFPFIFTNSNETPVSQILVPTDGSTLGSTAADDAAIDPFSAGGGEPASIADTAAESIFLVAPRSVPKGVAIRFANDAAGANVYPLNNEPARLTALRDHIEAARKARRTGDMAKTGELYRQALRTLEMPFTAADPTPLYHHIPRGEELYSEATFASAVLASREGIPEMLSRLSRYAETRSLDADAASDIGRINLAKAQISRAYLIMRHAESSGKTAEDLYSRALGLSRAASDTTTDSDVSYFAELLSVELLSRKLALAHHRRAHADVRELVDDLRRSFTRLADACETDGVVDEEKAKVVSAYMASAAVLKARLGLWNSALERARTVTQSRPFSDTASARQLLSEEIFKPFIESGSRFLTPGEIRMHAKRGAWRKQLQAAVEHAHSPAFAQSAVAGSLGMFAGVAAELMLQSGHGAMLGALFAALGIAINRVRHGWKTEQAQYAGEIGTYERSPMESAQDVGRLAVQGGLDALMFVVPATLIREKADSFEVIPIAFSNFGNVVMRFAHWIGSGAVSLTDPETYARIGSSHGSMDALTVLYNIYTKGAALLFAANLAIPQTRAFTRKLAPAFLPGALMFSADLSMLAAGLSSMDFTPHFSNAEYFSRVKRAGIVFGEIYAMCLTAGILTLDKRGSVKDVAQSLLKTTLKADYSLPLAAAIITGISSPLGAMIQKGIKIETQDIAALALLGAATAFCKLPITLGLSGVLKGKIPIGAGIKEGWEDSEGQHTLRRLYEAASGGAGAFDMPYAHNRIGRIPYWDLFAEIPRTLLGYDTNAGQLAMSGVNYVAGNGASTAMWTEPSGTRWERDSILEQTRDTLKALKGIEEAKEAGKIDAKTAHALEAEAWAKMRNFFVMPGQVMHPAHPFMPYARMRDRLWPFYSFTRSLVPPTFPQVPNGFFYSNLQQMLRGGNFEKLSKEDVGVILRYAAMDAVNPEMYDVVRPLIQTLAMAKDSPVFGEEIRAFFEQNKWIADVMNVNPEDYRLPEGSTRRASRKLVRKMVKMSIASYRQRVEGHRRLPANDPNLSGLFEYQPTPPRDPAATRTRGVETDGAAGSRVRVRSDVKEAKGMAPSVVAAEGVEESVVEDGQVVRRIDRSR
ncbi:MAG: hypothetical protein WC956_01385 [bacterium]